MMHFFYVSVSVFNLLLQVCFL